MNFTAIAVTMSIALLTGSPVHASQDQVPSDTLQPRVDQATIDAPLMRDGTLIAFMIDAPQFVLGPTPRDTRPRMLPALYVSLIGLQVYDGYSTSIGVSRDVSEANPLLRAAVEQPVALWSIKAGSTAASIYMAERLWRKHRRGQAIGLMIATNVVMATVAGSNASVIARRRVVH